MKHAKEGLVWRLAAVQFSVLGIVPIVPVVKLVTIADSLALARYFSLAAAADASATVTHEAVSLLLDAKLHVSDGNRCLALVHTCKMVCLLVIMAAFVEACSHNALSLCRRLRPISTLLFQLRCSGFPPELVFRLAGNKIICCTPRSRQKWHGDAAGVGSALHLRGGVCVCII